MELLLNEAVYDLWVRATCFADDDLIDETEVVDYVFDNLLKMYPCVAYLGPVQSPTESFNIQFIYGEQITEWAKSFSS
jgi:hypothetical protein